MAHIVNHLDEVIDVDDELLVYLHEMRGEREQVGALHAAFQPDRLPVIRHHHLPASHFVIILEEADILLIHQPEIHGVGIEEQLAVSNGCILHASPYHSLSLFFSLFLSHKLFSCLFLCFFLQASDDGIQLLGIDRLEQHIECLLAEGCQDIFIVCRVHHHLAAAVHESRQLIQEIQAIHIGQLDIQEEHIGLVPVYHRQAVKPTERASQHLHIVFRFQ